LVKVPAHAAFTEAAVSPLSVYQVWVVISVIPPADSLNVHVPTAFVVGQLGTLSSGPHGVVAPAFGPVMAAHV
jgi:hypothetical protein